MSPIGLTNTEKVYFWGQTVSDTCVVKLTRLTFYGNLG